MHEVERQALEHEIQEHMTRVEELAAILRDLEENLEQVVDPPPQLLSRRAELKLELRGRMAAIAMGEARLGIDPL